MTKITLIYFKPSGEYYSEGSYETSQTTFYDVCEEVREMVRTRQCPDLVDGHTQFITSIVVADGLIPHSHPCLIMPHEDKRAAIAKYGEACAGVGTTDIGDAKRELYMVCGVPTSLLNVRSS
jgi:hypothetical protein